MDDIMDVRLKSSSTLAFVGDAIFGLLVREKLANRDMPLKKLHSLSVKYVNATSQSKQYEIIKNILTEEETEVFKRGRNAKVSNIPKNSSVAEYHTATGLETLFGYLYLKKYYDRLNELFNIAFKKISEEL